ncbi:MAG: diguanylate cyclase [Gemmatimonadales bacterium]|nr:diguanylate cyclase [Gemmatimonadales bacterium]
MLSFSIDVERCVACLACVRVCPTNAIEVLGEAPLLRVVDESCIRCGACVPSCAHDAVLASGEVGHVLELAASGGAALIVAPEVAAHFYPATPEQVVNACYAAGFRVVSRGVLGDELVAGAYLRLWQEEPWGTLIRSTDPVVVEAITSRYPELVPYLAPVTTPPVAEARYLRGRYGADLPVAYAGLAPVRDAELDATITFRDLEQVLRMRDIDPRAQPTYFVRIPEERRRHLSAAGGLPLALLDEGRAGGRPLRVVRGLDGLPALARAVAVDRIDLGFVDLLATEGTLGHPLSGPAEQLHWRRSVVASTEPPRSRTPVVDDAVVGSVGATFTLRPRVVGGDRRAVEGVLEAIGLGPTGRPWDCGACGFATCERFAEAAVQGRATLRQCPPHQARRAEAAQRSAAVDLLTGLATYGVLRERLQSEIERSRRSDEPLALLFLDLDTFKQVNDTYGHEAGNAILEAVAAEIRSVVRASDVAARYGGDEFVVILTRTDLLGATRVAEALRVGIEGVGRRLGYPDGCVTVSVGVAEFDPRRPPDADVLVTADRALYRAKAAGRNAIAGAARQRQPEVLNT